MESGSSLLETTQIFSMKRLLGVCLHLCYRKLSTPHTIYLIMANYFGKQSVANIGSLKETLTVCLRSCPSLRAGHVDVTMAVSDTMSHHTRHQSSQSDRQDLFVAASLCSLFFVIRLQVTIK